jgi:S1-C subfamily serine protease
MVRIFLLSVFALLISSCAGQVNFAKSASKVKKSILKLEAWVYDDICNEETQTCGEWQHYATGTGSVVLVGRQKVVLTAAHVCDSSHGYSDAEKVLFRNKKVMMKAYDRLDRLYYLHILKSDKRKDICIMKFDDTDDVQLPPLRLSVKKPEYAEKVFAIGAPTGMLEGGMAPIYEGLSFGELGGKHFYGIPTIGGLSGSPILNVRGELVGMIHSVHYRFHHISLSVSYGHLWNFLKTRRSRTLLSPN